MIVSSVYSWLKDLRSSCDLYEDKLLQLQKPSSSLRSYFGRKCSCSCNTSTHEDMFEIQEIESVLLRSDLRRSFPLKNTKNGNIKCAKRGGGIVSTGFADLCIQERAKKAWSVGDAWGIDFQLKKPTKHAELEVDKGRGCTRRDSELTDDTVKEVLDEFAFLSDVEMENDVVKEEPIYVNVKKEGSSQKNPVYVNIRAITNPKLQQLIRDDHGESEKRQSTTSTVSLTSTYSFVSCQPSDGSQSDTETEFEGGTQNSESFSSGTYTLYSNASFADCTQSKTSLTSTYSGSTFQTEDTISDLDLEDWKREEWRSLCSLKDDIYSMQALPHLSNQLGQQLKRNHPLKPLKKGKSLDSFNMSSKLTTFSTKADDFEVELRPKINPKRRSVIPVVDSLEYRKAIIVPKCPTPVSTPEQGPSAYMNLWECFSQHQHQQKLAPTPEVRRKFKPVPAPRTKLLIRPSSPAQPMARELPSRKVTRLEVKQARENIVSFIFDETVELLKEKQDGDEEEEKRVVDESKEQPPMDVIMWLTRLMVECDGEPEFHEPTNACENEHLLMHAGPSGSHVDERRKDMMGPQTPSPGLPGISWDTGDNDYRDNKFDFSNVKKYKMENQLYKVNKNDCLEKQNGRLMHKHSEGTTTLTDKYEDCTLEQKGPREHVLILPDKKRINLYSRNPKSASPTDSPESIRSAPPAKTDMKNRLMQFFKRRPARDTLRERGILMNESYFGNTLKYLDSRMDSSVPELVTMCIEYVELPGNIITQGLYRSSASLAILQEIRFAINEKHGKDLSSLEKYKMSPDVPSGLLKLFIRELKESLIGMEHFEKMFAVCQSGDCLQDKYNAMFEIVGSMIPPHRNTLECLLVHLIKVISHQDKNDMTFEGISICWGQTMITGDEGSDPVLMAKRKNVVLELLLRAYQKKTTPSNNQTSTLSQAYVQTKQKDTKEEVKDTKEQTKLSKPTRVPQRYASVETHMKPRVSNDATISKTTNTLTKTESPTDSGGGGSGMFGSRTSIGSGLSGLSGTSGTYVQNVVHKFQESGIMLQGRNMMFAESMTSLNSLGGISASSLSQVESDLRCLRLKFIQDLIMRIECCDFREVYRGKGKKSMVNKLLRKYKKENSKKLMKLLNKADVIVLGHVLQEVVKEMEIVIDFHDMQALVENINTEEIKHILEEIPEEFILLFRHFDKLIKTSNDQNKVTLIYNLFEGWWSILIGIPNQESLQSKDIIGKNISTFEMLIENILSFSAKQYLHQMQTKIKCASLFDLRQMNNVDTKIKKKVSCCTGDKRMTSFYSKEKLSLEK